MRAGPLPSAWFRRLSSFFFQALRSRAFMASDLIARVSWLDEGGIGQPGTRRGRPPDRRRGAQLRDRFDSGATRCYQNEHVADDRLRMLSRRPLGPAARVSPSATFPDVLELTRNGPCRVARLPALFAARGRSLSFAVRSRRCHRNESRSTGGPSSPPWAWPCS